MKKKILFVMGDLTLGGAEKSLISILHSIDYSKYDIDLFLFKKIGLLLDFLPTEVKIIENDKSADAYFSRNIFFAIKYLLMLKRYDLILWRICLKILSGYGKVMKYNVTQLNQLTWFVNKHAYMEKKVQYDLAIGYLQTTPVYYIVDKIKAKKKIAWMHTDYKNSKANSKYDMKYYRNIDRIYTVSEDCLENLKNAIPKYKNKMAIFNNIISEKLIINMSKEECNYRELYNGTAILTIAGNRYPKGVDLAINTCKLLKEKGKNIKWYLIGPYQDDKLRQEIKNKNLEDCFILLGETINPYKYLSRCDIYVQPSRYEGYCMAVAEAKILEKPIIVTAHPALKKQIVDNETGIIADINSKGIYTGICKILKDNVLKQTIVNNLHKNHKNCENEIDKLYDIFME